ncbi:MAG: acetyl-CoA hydrolase/transferase C-terminal domain-containing protein [Chloroflexota bacterium]
MTSRKDEFQHKLISVEEAANLVKPGMRVAFTGGRDARTIGLAIAARKEELNGVHVLVPTPSFDYPWYDEGWQDSFTVSVMVTNAISEPAIRARRIDFDPGTMIPLDAVEGARETDICLVEVSPPDDNGYCSFGNSVWAKKRQCASAKLVIGEVNPHLIRTYGDNFIHISEIDYFVEHVSSGSLPRGTLTGRKVKGVEPHHEAIAGYVSSLIKDGDTIQIGGGRTTEPLVGIGLLDGKHDLGYHSELAPGGVIRLVREGVINGKYKTVNRGKTVVTAIGGGTIAEMRWVNMNPLFHVVDVGYLEDPRIISAHDNFISINNILAIDLTGQVTSESIGTMQIAHAGGQIAFVVGAGMSRGGRSVLVLPSTVTTAQETVSRIMPVFPEGTTVTLSRNFTDYVVTEYGIARLKGRTLRERANELIGVAHPDFRNGLRKAAQQRFYP